MFTLFAEVGVLASNFVLINLLLGVADANGINSESVMSLDTIK